MRGFNLSHSVAAHEGALILETLKCPLLFLDESQAAAMSSVKSVFSRKAVVRMQLLKEVVGSDSYRVNNKYDDDHTPLAVDEIIERAQVLIGQEVSYDLLGSNCEHFVTLLRYGEGVSEQVPVIAFAHTHLDTHTHRHTHTHFLYLSLYGYRNRSFLSAK